MQNDTEKDTGISPAAGTNPTAADHTAAAPTDVDSAPLLTRSAEQPKALGQEERDITFTVDLTSICVKTAAIRLPYTATDLFAEETGMIVHHLEGRREYVLTFTPPRQLGNLTSFFLDTNAKANDKLTLKLHGNRGEIELTKRQATRYTKRRREAIGTSPTKHELLTAANRSLEKQDPEAGQPAKEQASKQPVPFTAGTVRVKPPAGETSLAPKSAVPKDALETALQVPDPRLAAVPTPQPHNAYTPATPSDTQQAPSPSEPYSPTAQRMSAPSFARPSVPQSATSQSSTPQAAAPTGAAKHYGLDDDLLDDIPDMPAALMKDPLAGTNHALKDPEAVVPARTHMETPEQLNRATMEHLLSLFQQPTTPSILRVDVLAEGIGLSPAVTQAALQQLSQGEDAAVRPIRAGVFQIIKRDTVSF